MIIRTSHVVTAVLLHVIVIGLLLVGFHCTRKVEAPPVMQATIIDSKPAAKPAPTPPKPQVDEHKQEEERKQREEDQRKKQQELEEQRKVEQQQKIEQQRKQDEQRKAQVAEQQRQKKEEQERKVKEERERREAEKKKKEEQLQQQLREQMSSEETERKTAATSAAQNQWVDAIRAKVIPNFNPPPGAPDEFQCRVHVSLLPGGQVVGVKLLESCGNPILDSSVERAIRKSDPLPTPDNPAAFDRELEFTFVPHL